MKICSMCGKQLSLDNFSWKNKAKGIYQSRCKDCQSQVDRQYYLSNQQRREDVRKRAKQTKQDAREYITNYKKEHPCCICGENRWYLLDYHHVDNNKELELSRVRYWSITKIQQEIDKCAVMCANCHRDFHWQEANDGITFQQYTNKH